MSGYAKDVLVEADWLVEHLGDDSIRIVEVDENPDLYAEAHIPGARYVGLEFSPADLPPDKDAMLVFYCESAI